MKRKLFSDDVYCVDVLALSGTFEEAKKELEKRECGFVMTDRRTEGFCTKTPKGGLVVWLAKPKDFYVLMHETLHLVRMVFTDNGVITDLAAGDEHIAYYHAYWFKRLWRFYGNIKR